MNRPGDRTNNQHPADVNDGREEKGVRTLGSDAPKKVTAAPDPNSNKAVGRWNVLGRDGHGNPRLACQWHQAMASSRGSLFVRRRRRESSLNAGRSMLLCVHRRGLGFACEKLTQNILQDAAVSVVKSLLRCIDSQYGLEFG